MMRSIKLVGLAIVAVLAIGAMSAGSASAVELIKFSKTGNFTGKSTGKTELEVSNGDKIECQTATTKGTIETEEKGKALVLFEKCIEPKTLATCTSAGSPSGEIHIPDLLILLGSDSGTEMNPAVLLKPSNPSTGAEEPVVFKCVSLSEATVTVKGSVICLVKNTTTTKEIELLCEKGAKAGEQKDKFFWDIGQSGTENVLKSSATGFLGFTELESNQQGTALLKGENANEIQIEV